MCSILTIKKAPPVTFTPRLDILPPPQRLLWDELGTTPANFVLYGGTALALHLGHRDSIDFDFFAFQPINPILIKQSVPYLQGARVIDSQPNTLTCLVDRDGPVKVSFFGVPNIRQYRDFHKAPGNNLPIASLHDIAGTKAQTVQSRAAVKDYVDIDALISLGKIPLIEHLFAARHIFGPDYEPLPTLKALSYFEDVPDLPDNVRRRLLESVEKVDPTVMPAGIP